MFTESYVHWQFCFKRIALRIPEINKEWARLNSSKLGYRNLLNERGVYSTSLSYCSQRWQLTWQQYERRKSCRHSLCPLPYPGVWILSILEMDSIHHQLHHQEASSFHQYKDRIKLQMTCIPTIEWFESSETTDMARPYFIAVTKKWISRAWFSVVLGRRAQDQRKH